MFLDAEEARIGNNMAFKKSFIATAVVLAMSSSSVIADMHADEMHEEATPKYDHSIYGLIALQGAYRSYDDAPNMDGMQLNNESRIGWRGHAKFDALPEHTKFVWQIEAGYVDPSFDAENGGGYLGERDTFIGLDSTMFGLLRAGRVLSPLYELVDWPASNPGLGDVWDGGSMISGNDFNDRQSDTIRWDSPELWKGFTVDFAFGAGADRAGDTESEKADSNYWHGIAAHQKWMYSMNGWVQLDLAYEMNYDTEMAVGDSSTKNEYWDNTTFLFGVQGGHAGLGYFAQYRMSEAKSDTIRYGDEEQNGYSVGLMYNFGMDDKWQAKVAYASLDDLETDANSNADYLKDRLHNGDVWALQMQYMVDTNALVYVRYRDVSLEKYVDNTNMSEDDSFNEASVGIEYWF